MPHAFICDVFDVRSAEVTMGGGQLGRTEIRLNIIAEDLILIWLHVPNVYECYDVHVHVSVDGTFFSAEGICKCSCADTSQ